MTKLEQRFVDFINEHIYIIAAILVTILALLIRKPLMETMSRDYLPNLIEVEGNSHTTFYMTCLNVLAKIDRKPLFFMLKLVIIGLDFLAAAGFSAGIYLLCRRGSNRDASSNRNSNSNEIGQRSDNQALLPALLAYSLYLMLPMTLMNSSIWGHLDSGVIFLICLGIFFWYGNHRNVAAILVGVGCSLLSHYLLIVVLLAGVLYRSHIGDREISAAIKEKKARTETAKIETTRSVQKPENFLNIGVPLVIFAATIIICQLTGLAFGYSPVHTLTRLNFIHGAGTFYLFPILILLLGMCFQRRAYLLPFVLLQLAVILDWGEFLYEETVLPGNVSLGLYGLGFLTVAVVSGLMHKYGQSK